jgi:DNA-binding CsgD family transcriptional regulator/tetratricopeptide (TPR) repeat protein
LSVFSGGWTVEAAEFVCASDSSSDAGQASAVVDGLSALIDHSLVRQIAQPDGSTRYNMLETLREYGQERLADHHELDETSERHADYFLTVAESVAPHLEGDDPVPFLRQLANEHDNLRAALDWLLAGSAARRGLRFVVAMFSFWHIHGHYAEGLARADAFLALPDAAARTPERAHALHTATQMALWQHNEAVAVARGEEALSIWQELGDRSQAPALYNELGMATGVYRRAASADDEREALERSRAYLERGLDLAREIGDTEQLGLILNNLGINAQNRGDLDLSAMYFAEARAVSQALGDKRVISLVTHGRGRLAYLQGDYPLAATLFRESLLLFHERDEAWGIALGLGKSAILAQLHHDSERAARLFGAAEALHERIGSPPSVSQRRDHEPVIPAVRAALGDDAFRAAWSAGRALSVDDAVALALETTLPDPVTPSSRPTRHLLSPRELEVVRGIVAGQSNPEIAAELFISPNTVSNHVANIMNKLGLDSRTAVATWAVRNGIE